MAVICGMPAPVTMRVVQMEPGPNANLDGVGARVDEGHRTFVSSHVAGQQANVREALLHFAYRIEHARGVAVR